MNKQGVTVEEGIKKIIERAKDKSSGFRLMGFGHRFLKYFNNKGLQKFWPQVKDNE